MGFRNIRRMVANHFDNIILNGGEGSLLESTGPSFAKSGLSNPTDLPRENDLFF